MKKYVSSLLCVGLILSLPACCNWCKKEEAKPAVVETAPEAPTVETTIDAETATTEEIAPATEQVVEVAAADAKPAELEADVKA